MGKQKFFKNVALNTSRSAYQTIPYNTSHKALSGLLLLDCLLPRIKQSLQHLSSYNKMEVHFRNGLLSEISTHQAQGHCYGGESICPARVRAFLPTDSRKLLLLLALHPILDLSTLRFVLCPHLHLSHAILAVHVLGHLAHLLALPEQLMQLKNTQFPHCVFITSKC
jgi:hypothetical protein